MPAARNLILLLPLLTLLTYPLWQPHAAKFLNPAGEPAGRAPKTSQPGSGSLTMEEAEISQFSRGSKDWLVEAQGLIMDDEISDVRLEQVRAIFPDRDAGKGGSRAEVKVSGEHARYLQKEKILTLTDQVLITTASGYEIRCGLARFLENTRQIKADSDVRIGGNNLTIRGRALTYTIDARALLVEGGVKARIQ